MRIIFNQIDFVAIDCSYMYKNDYDFYDDVFQYIIFQYIIQMRIICNQIDFVGTGCSKLFHRERPTEENKRLFCCYKEEGKPNKEANKLTN